jgi:hypothetical protein
MARAFATLLAAGVAGFLLWIAAGFDRQTTGGYWAALGLIAAGGILLGIAQMRGARGNPPGMFLFAFLPIAIVAGWVLVTGQPHPNWFANHLGAWSRDLGVGDVVARLGEFYGVLAFGIGLAFGLTLEPAARQRPTATPVATPAELRTPSEPDPVTANEPTAAEREEQDASAAGYPSRSGKTATRTLSG